jgi:putative tricarboxylic transport membrane protein
VLGISAVFALALVISDLLQKPRERKKESLNYFLVVQMFAVFGLYCGALPYLGFRIATLLYLAASNAILEPPRGVKGWARVAAVAIITTVIVYYAFERYLTVLLPRGRWTDF